MPDINFIFFLDVFRKFNSQLIRKRYFPDKIIIVISLKGWGEGLDSTESWSFLSQGFGFAHHEIFQNFGVLLLLFFHSLRFHRKGDVFSEICFGDHGCFHIRILRDRNQAYFLHIQKCDIWLWSIQFFFDWRMLFQRDQSPSLHQLFIFGIHLLLGNGKGSFRLFVRDTDSIVKKCIKFCFLFDKGGISGEVGIHVFGVGLQLPPFLFTHNLNLHIAIFDGIRL